jgi:hypothetical protein
MATKQELIRHLASVTTYSEEFLARKSKGELEDKARRMEVIDRMDTGRHALALELADELGVDQGKVWTHNGRDWRVPAPESSRYPNPGCFYVTRHGVEFDRVRHERFDEFMGVAHRLNVEACWVDTPEWVN